MLLQRGCLVDPERGAVADDATLVFGHELALGEMGLLASQHLGAVAIPRPVHAVGQFEQLRDIIEARLAHHETATFGSIAVSHPLIMTHAGGQFHGRRGHPQNGYPAAGAA